MRACQHKDAKRVEERASAWEAGLSEVGRKSTHTWRGERESARARTHMEQRERALWLLLLYVFFLPWACPMQIGLSQECCLFYLRYSLRSWVLPLFYFRGLFPSLSFSYCHFEILFPILNYPTLLYNIVLVLPYIDMNPPWVYMCSPS